jgi:nucleotidyltransferase substrate binding protein (TIGR01987 family)
MEKLEYKYAVVVKSGKAFGRAIKRYQKKYPHASDEDREDCSASLIKHFELFYGALWKFLKFYLMEKHGTETVGSKDVFRALYDRKLIDDEQLASLMAAVEIRNETTHVYDEEFAERVSAKVINLYPAMDYVVSLIKI